MKLRKDTFSDITIAEFGVDDIFDNVPLDPAGGVVDSRVARIPVNVHHLEKPTLYLEWDFPTLSDDLDVHMYTMDTNKPPTHLSPWITLATAISPKANPFVFISLIPTISVGLPPVTILDNRLYPFVWIHIENQDNVGLTGISGKIIATIK